MLRRVLLGLVTALIVARPLVLGEDPGLNEPLSDPYGLVLTVLWFAAATGWAAWRLWSGKATWYASAVEGGLGVAAVLVWVSTLGAARYRYPALLIGCEWLALLVVFCLVRQLARTAADNQRLLAAVLAGGVSLSAYAVYQYAVELPQLRQSLLPKGEVDASGQPDLEKLRARLAQEGIAVGDPGELQAWVTRIIAHNAFATFANPNSFAGFLALLFPPLVGATLLSWRIRGRTWAGLGGALCAVLMAVALWLTHSRGAILALLLVGAAVGLLKGWRWLWEQKARVLVGLAGLAGLAGVMYWWGWRKAGGVNPLESLLLRRDYWIATEAMIRDHLWLGVGPGNFGRWYPRYMLPTAWEKIADPHNLVLEMWATCGLVAALGLVVTLAAFFRYTLPAILRPLREKEPMPSDDPPSPAPWEFYLGGMAGLILGYVLWASGQSGAGAADMMILGAVVSGGRALVWFVAFALLEGLAWSGPSRTLALTAGVAALLLNLLVSAGLTYPSVAQPLWFLAALALNSLPALSVPWQTESRVHLLLPLPLLAAGCLLYYFFLLNPAVASAAALDQASRHYPIYLAKIRHAEQLPADARQPYLQDAQNFLRSYILKPLKEARDRNPLDVVPWFAFAHWYEEQLERFYPSLSEDRNMKLLVEKIEDLDPEGETGYLIEYRLWKLLAQRSATDQVKNYQQAARALQQAVERDPTEARLHYQLAEVLLLAKDEEGNRREAQKALALDQVAPPVRQLTAAERAQIGQWLGSPAPS